MTIQLVDLPITLTIAGPILTAGSTLVGWGVDITFYRDWQDRLALPASHIKGKLKEAMAGLNDLKRSAGLPIGPWDDKKWFGQQANDKFEPDRGRLKVTDFILVKPADAANAVNTRIRIEEERSTVEKGALLITEQPFKPGQSVQWQGNVEFLAPKVHLDDLSRQLKEAFCFITAIGAEKSIGWGQLKQVEFGKASLTEAPATIIPNGSPTRLKLAIEPKEPLLIGGTANTDNIFVSESNIPGTAIKGAYATGLNRLAGQRANQPINDANTIVNEKWPELATHFGALQFLQAVPSFTKHHRNGPPPLSLGDFDDRCTDVAFEKEEGKILSDGLMPVAFQVDWKATPKHLPEKYHRPELQYHATTRTAIEPEMRKADDSKLYVMQAIKPLAKDKDETKQLYWNTEIRIPADLDKEIAGTIAKLVAQIRETLRLALRYVGKRQTIIKIECKTADQIQPTAQAGIQSFAIVLQSPAIMLNPHALAVQSKVTFDDAAIMLNQYRNYWAAAKMLGETAEMVRHFSAIELQGGYLGMRCMKEKGHYAPFVLTQAGSVFVFQVKTPEAIDRLKRLEHSGLPLPGWALAEDVYGSTATWRRCPFVPENGYGEIKITIPQS